MIKIATNSSQKIHGIGDNLIVTNGSFENRMELFVIAFVKEFEARLYCYDLIYQEQFEVAERTSPSSPEKIMGDDGKYGGGIGEFLSTLALVSTSLSPSATAADGSVRFLGITAGKTGEEWISEKINRELHDRKCKGYANKLWHLIKLHKEDRITLRKILISAALNIFRCFEQQFVMVNNNKKWRKGVLDLAKDGVRRSMNYAVDHYETTNVTYEAIISKGVIEGKSKNRPYYTKPKLVYEDEKGKMYWTSTSLYEQSGIAIENDGKYSYYEKVSSKVGKYGYRLLLHAENWDVIKNEYRLSQENENQFKNYKYQFKTLNDDERNQISNKIDSDNDILTKGSLKELIEEMKQSVLNEINQSLELHCKEANSDDSEILQKIARNINKINVQELENKFLEHSHEIKRSLPEMYEKEELHYSEIMSKHQETQTILCSINDAKLSENNRPIWFDIISPLNMFTRKNELHFLDKIISGKERDAEQKITKSVIWGLGGIGKTQLARQYIEEIGRKIYENIIWINSETETDIIESFIRLAKKLKLKIPEDKKDKMKIILNEVYEILSKKDTLFIFDNAEKSKTFMDMLPKTAYFIEKKMHTLITSRDREWGINISDMHLQELSLEDGMQLVKEQLNITDDSEDENIKRLLDKVQNFPLSINQAASYIRERKFSARFTITDYLNEFEKIPRDLFDSDSFKEFDNDPYTKTTYTTWMITVNKIKRDNLIGDLAIQIFNIMSYLAPQNIKRKIFLNITENNVELEKATRLLAKYSMIDIFDETAELLVDISIEDDNSDEVSFKILRTVQDVTRLHIKENNADDEVIENTFRVLTEYLVLPQATVINYDKMREGLPHFEIFLTHIRNRLNAKHEEKLIEIYKDVMEFLRVYYFHIGNRINLTELLHESMIIYQKYYGPDHYLVARVLTHLGNAYGSLGDVKKQKELLEKALNIEEKYYGTDHYEVAITLASLGIAYGSLGDVRKEIELLEKALKIKEKHYGTDHYEVARTLTNLGNAYGSLGNVQKQKEILEKALIIGEKHYGPNHHDVAITLASLGTAYGSLGDIRKEKELLEKALKIKESHYGPDHYLVARVLTHLGNAYGSLGDVQKQKELLEKALNIQEKHYGPNHYEVAITLVSLGIAYGSLGDVLSKKKLLEKALLIFEKHFGSNHFILSYALENIGIAFGELGDNEKKRDFLNEAVRLKSERFGSYHYEIAYPLQNLAIAYGDLGNIDKKLELLQLALSINEKHYGSGHHTLGFALENLGVVYRDLGETEKGIQLLEQALSIEEKYYGSDYFQLAFALENLGIAFGNLGHIDQQIAFSERALSIKEKHYGANHYQLGPTLYNLAVAYDTLGDSVKKNEFLAKAFNYF